MRKKQKRFRVRFDSLTGGDLTSCLSASEDPPITRVQNVVGTSSTCAVGKLFVWGPRILPFTSFREVDLDFPAHWPEYYYQWKGNNIGWTAGSGTICCTSAPFMVVCGPETRPAPRSLQAAELFRSGYLNLISLQRVLMVPSCSLDQLPWNAVWWNRVGRLCQDAQVRKKGGRVEIKNSEIRRGQIYSSQVHSYLCSVS